MNSDFKYQPPLEQLRIVKECEDYLAVDKPSGLLAVPGRSSEHKDSLLNRLKKMYKDIFVIHRLDMDTSGLILFAKNRQFQASMSKLFSEGTVKKLYLAKVLGKINGVGGIIDFPLVKDWPKRPLQKVCYNEGKPSKTRWRLFEYSSDKKGQIYSHLLLRPLTGRTHQIRIHLSKIGFPIVGDRFYGLPKSKNIETQLNLHAHALKFRHQHSGKLVYLKTNWLETSNFFENTEITTNMG